MSGHQVMDVWALNNQPGRWPWGPYCAPTALTEASLRFICDQRRSRGSYCGPQFEGLHVQEKFVFMFNSKDSCVLTLLGKFIYRSLSQRATQNPRVWVTERFPCWAGGFSSGLCRGSDWLGAKQPASRMPWYIPGLGCIGLSMGVSW